MELTKICTQCKNVKRFSDFGPRKDGKLKLRSTCKDCDSYNVNVFNSDKDLKHGYHLKKKLGIGLLEYKFLNKAQNNKCIICRNSPVLNKRLYVDHDHKTGKIRGLLCQTCNTGLGYFKDNIDYLSGAIEYLKVHNGTF